MMLKFEKVQDNPKPEPSTIYFILHRQRNGYSEIGITAEGELFIRFTNVGKVMAKIPLGKANGETIKKLQANLDRIYEIFLSQETP